MEIHNYTEKRGELTVIASNLIIVNILGEGPSHFTIAEEAFVSESDIPALLD